MSGSSTFGLSVDYRYLQLGITAIFPQTKGRAHEAHDITVYRIAVDNCYRICSTAAECQNERNENRYNHYQSSDCCLQLMCKHNYQSAEEG
jgi:hypothetical protein